MGDIPPFDSALSSISKEGSDIIGDPPAGCSPDLSLKSDSSSEADDPGTAAVDPGTAAMGPAATGNNAAPMPNQFSEEGSRAPAVSGGKGGGGVGMGVYEDDVEDEEDLDEEIGIPE
ncbi:hypothetical protein L218DRAFT_951724 [Marasmius fiardii PR-910]|nr:hypothetical protein L218DRAFT_951724 [Marasmius fiardii PR-910]